MNTPILTISPVQQEDEDEYYCVASYGVVHGTLHNDASNKANITVYSKDHKIYNRISMLIILCW